MVSGPGENGERRMTVAEMRAFEAERVAALLKRDRADFKAERRRKDAEREVKAGKFGNIEDTILGPTPELMRTGEFAPHTPDKTDGTVRSLTTLRRVQHSRIIALHSRGVLDDDTFPACLWYRKAWENCGFDLSASAAAWGEQIPGERSYGFGPKTPAQVEARHNFRHARQVLVPDTSVLADVRLLALFDRVVLDELTIDEVALEHQCRRSTATLRLQLVAWRLRGGIGHLLPSREIGALGGEANAPGKPAGSSPEAREALPDTNPALLDDRGYFRPWAEVAEILRTALNEEDA